MDCVWVHLFVGRVKKSTEIFKIVLLTKHIVRHIVGARRNILASHRTTIVVSRIPSGILTTECMTSQSGKIENSFITMVPVNAPTLFVRGPGCREAVFVNATCRGK